MTKEYDNWYNVIWNDEDEAYYDELYYTPEVETIKDLEQKMEERFKKRVIVARNKLYVSKRYVK